MKCPGCGAAASGAFCAHCGAALGTPSCRRCGGVLPDGARFCTQCGAGVRGASSAPLHMIALGLVALVAVAAGAYWLGAREDAPAAFASAAPLGSTSGPMAGSPPPLTGTVREQADRLFERIMQARARGDREEVEFFMPMALSAYESVPDIDADGLFHHGLLLIEAGRADQARTRAELIRTADNAHLFGHALEAEAALAAGDTAAAITAFGAYLDSFDAEIASGAQEYQVHRPALDEYRSQARILTRR